MITWLEKTEQYRNDWEPLLFHNQLFFYGESDDLPKVSPVPLRYQLEL